MRAIDQLNAQFGRCTIGFGMAGERQAWSLRREFTPLRFTTDWNELLRAFKAEPTASQDPFAPPTLLRRLIEALRSRA
jgi:hypothetical protein